MTVKMDVRQELWKYVEVSQHTIKDWKQMLFKKVRQVVLRGVSGQVKTAQVMYLDHCLERLTSSNNASAVS